jgi:hypothetical protein
MHTVSAIETVWALMWVSLYVKLKVTEIPSFDIVIGGGMRV